jgi:uncharacterized protein (TIGR03437 family)
VTCTVSPLSAALVQVTAPSIPPLTILSSASGLGVAAPASYASAYGNGLASTVSMRDSAGVPYTPTVIYSSPTQVNFEIPFGVAAGASVVTIGSQSAALQIATVAPGLFALDTAGLAAAYTIVVGPGNTQTVAPIFAVQNGSIIAVPIALSQLSTDQVYLILYGTGIRGAGNNVTVAINGINAPVLYSGPQVQYADLDQVNVLLPPQLAGSSHANIVLSAAGITSNTVNVLIQ